MTTITKEEGLILRKKYSDIFKPASGALQVFSYRTLDDFSNGGSINEINQAIYLSLVKLYTNRNEHLSILESTELFDQIQNYLDEEYIIATLPSDSLFDKLATLKPLGAIDPRDLITEENLNKSVYIVEFYLESFRLDQSYFTEPQNIALRAFF